MAYKLWERIDQELYRRKLTQTWLVEKTGIPASTWNNLEFTTRPPQARIIHAAVEALGIDPDEAEILSGRRRAALPDDISVQEAIEQSSAYTPAQKEALLAMVRVLDEANGIERTPTGERETRRTPRAI